MTTEGDQWRHKGVIRRSEPPCQRSICRSSSGSTISSPLSRVRVPRVSRSSSFEGIYPEDGLFGIWLNTGFGDYILHAPTASELHRRQIVLHELAHMILGHDLATGQTSAAALFPDLPEEAVLRTLARGHTDNAMEREAEALADLLASSLRHNRRHSSFVRVFG